MAARVQRRRLAVTGARRPGRRRAHASTRGARIALGLLLLALVLAVRHFGLYEQARDALDGPPARLDIAGTARITDGDTLRIGDRRIRLNGIDAPEADQRCAAAAGAPRNIACGTLATAALRDLIGTAPLSCVAEGTDRYGRMLATCYTGTDAAANLNRAMVRAGWALAYRRYSNRYALDETAARLAGAGLWAMDFDAPEDFRRAAAR
jgi:endonuclease YncB( thermonuclease family)